MFPTPDNLETMDYVFKGQSFVELPAKDAVDLKTMDYVYKGQPFVGNYGEGVTQNAIFFGTDF